MRKLIASCAFVTSCVALVSVPNSFAATTTGTNAKGVSPSIVCQCGDGSYPYLFNGGNYQAANYIRGGSAWITTSNTVPAVPSGDTYAVSSTWILAAHDASGNYPGLAQVGFIVMNYWNTSPFYFFEDDHADGSGVDILSNGNTNTYSKSSNGTSWGGHNLSGAVGPAAGSNHYYKIYRGYTNGSGQYVDNGVWYGSVDGAFSNYFQNYDTSWAPQMMQFQDEVHDLPVGARYYGTPSSPVNFSTMTYFDYNTGYATYASPLTTGLEDTSSGHAGRSITNNGDGSQTMKVWDINP